LGFESIQKEFFNNEVLDEFQVRGLFINWWNENKFDLRTIKESGWVQSLLSNFDFENEDNKAIDETLEKVKYFFKEKFEKEISYIEKLEEHERELSAEIEEQTQVEEMNNEEEEPEPIDKVLKNEIKALKVEIKECNKTTEREHHTKLQKMLDEKEAELEKITAKQNELKQIKKQINEKNGERVGKVKAVVENISEEEAEQMVIMNLQNSAMDFLNSYLTAQKQKIISYFENLWDKYGVDVRIMEQDRDKYAKELDKYLKELGYESK
jgi:type I restriction enzyme M protein